MHPPESAIIHHPLPIQTHKPRILQKHPKEVSGHILLSPKRATPLSPLVRDLFSKVVVVSLAIQAPTEEDVCVV